MCAELPDRGENRGDAGRDRPEEAGGAGALQEPESREISHRQLQACALARLQGEAGGNGHHEKPEGTGTQGRLRLPDELQRDGRGARRDPDDAEEVAGGAQLCRGVPSDSTSGPRAGLLGERNGGHAAGLLQGKNSL